MLKKLKSKYRLLLINDRTFEERFSIRLSRLNVGLLFLGLFTLHGLFVGALIVFTPLKRYIPGYTDQGMKYNAYRGAIMADSLQAALADRDLYIANLRRVLRGEAPADSATPPTVQASQLQLRKRPSITQLASYYCPIVITDPMLQLGCLLLPKVTMADLALRDLAAFVVARDA